MSTLVPLLPLLAWSGAFWLALVRFRGDSSERWRLAVGLGLGAACAHLGWALLHADRLAAAGPGARLALLDPTRGASLLFAPLGVLAVARGRPGFRVRALRALPRAFALARVGCVAAGCCRGSGAVAGVALPPVAVPLAEIAAWLALDAVLARRPAPAVTPLFLAAFGGIRLALEPLRAAPPLGPPVLPVSALAALWLAEGSALAVAHGRRSRRPATEDRLWTAARRRSSPVSPSSPSSTSS